MTFVEPSEDYGSYWPSCDALRSRKTTLSQTAISDAHMKDLRVYGKRGPLIFYRAGRTCIPYELSSDRMSWLNTITSGQFVLGFRMQQNTTIIRSTEVCLVFSMYWLNFLSILMIILPNKKRGNPGNNNICTNESEVIYLRFIYVTGIMANKLDINFLLSCWLKKMVQQKTRNVYDGLNNAFMFLERCALSG